MYSALKLYFNFCIRIKRFTLNSSLSKGKWFWISCFWNGWRQILFYNHYSKERNCLWRKKLKALKKTIPVYISESEEEEPAEPNFKMAALFGESLLKMTETAAKYERRACFSKIQNFLKTPATQRTSADLSAFFM